MKRSPIRQVSKKRALQLKEYGKLRYTFLCENWRCRFANCANISADVHHKKGRAGKLLNDRKWWLPVCRPCHQWIEDHKREARKLGYILYKVLPFFLSLTGLVGATPAPQGLFYTSGTGETVDPNGNILLDADCDRTSRLATSMASSFTLCGVAEWFNADTWKIRAGGLIAGEHKILPVVKTDCANRGFKSHPRSTDSACPQSVASPAGSGFQAKPSVPESMADLYARIVLEEVPWYEPKDLGLR